MCYHEESLDKQRANLGKNTVLMTCDMSSHCIVMQIEHLCRSRVNVFIEHESSCRSLEHLLANNSMFSVKIYMASI